MSEICQFRLECIRAKLISLVPQISPYGSPIPLVFRIKFHPEIITFSLNGVVKQGRDGENKPFSSFKRQNLENSRRYDQSYY